MKTRPPAPDIATTIEIQALHAAFLEKLRRAFPDVRITARLGIYTRHVVPAKARDEEHADGQG